MPHTFKVYSDYGPLKNYSLVTDFDSALELAEKFKASAHNPHTVKIVVSTGLENILLWTDKDIEDYKEKYRMKPKNRVEARIMKEMAEKEPRFRDQIPELMGKTFPEKELDFHGKFTDMSKEEQDKVINPKHYKILPPNVLREFLDKGMEYMDIMRYALTRHKGVIAHVLGQVFKYSFRLGGKDDTLQDAKKIAWYANRLVEEIEYERGLSDTKPRGEYKE